MAHPPALFSRLNPDDYSLPTSVTEHLLSPSLVIFQDKVRANIQRVIELLGGDASRWRPHVKTTKMPAIWDDLHSAGITQFKCATTREAAELLSWLDRRQSIGDVLVAYPLVGPALEYLGQLLNQHPRQRVSMLCENPDDLQGWPPTLGVFIDLNPGMDRTGVPMNDRERILAIAEVAGNRFKGLHYYDGHHHQADHDERRAAVFAGYKELINVLEQLEAAGPSSGEVITAGTPALLNALEFEPLGQLPRCRHRVSPGTVVLHDGRSEEENPELGLEPAALVFSRVVSHPTANQVTFDAGSKSIAAEAGHPCAHVLGEPTWTAFGPSEEHLPADTGTGPQPPRGSTHLLIPRHVCPTVNLAREALMVGVDATHRPVSVSARAHDLFAPPA